MSEDNKNVADTLNEIFEDDPARKAREKEIAKYEKKRQKALEREEKKLAKKKLKENPELDENNSENEDAAVESQIEPANVEAQNQDAEAAKENADDEEIDEKALKRKLKEERKAEKKKAKAEKEVNIVKDLLFLCMYIIIVIGICWAVLTFVGQRTEVSGESMSNTLHSGDTLWIDKLEYEFGSPQRYDVVVFPYGDDEDTFYIKRIIGLPGETVYIDEDGNIFINDELLESDVYGRETIASDKRGVAADEITLGDDEYFVLGDNRNNSRDSRVADVGNIHKKDIIGRAVFRFTGGFGKIK
ncbi:MAG: signal peptidase I [Clostridiales bacterium]|nr:signal peptidase I [Clostridiales bacterium]